MCAESIENSQNEYAFGSKFSKEEIEAESNLLTVEHVKCTKPKALYGDLHITAEGFYFLAYEKADDWKQAIYVNLGLIGVWLAHWSNKKRKQRMTDWRVGHGGVYLDELVRRFEGSQFVSGEDITLIKSAFLSPGVVVEHGEKEKLAVEMPGKEVKKVLAFARERGWPVK
jgi:hypothetical protein